MPPEEILAAQEVGWAVGVVARRVPVGWPLPGPSAGRDRMLRRRGLEGTVSFGVCQGESSDSMPTPGCVWVPASLPGLPTISVFRPSPPLPGDGHERHLRHLQVRRRARRPALARADEGSDGLLRPPRRRLQGRGIVGLGAPAARRSTPKTSSKTNLYRGFAAPWSARRGSTIALHFLRPSISPQQKPRTYQTVG